MQYIPAKQHGPADNYPITRIVMHGTVSPCVVGGAKAVATMFHTSSRDASTQYVVDPATVIQCVPNSVIAYGAPPNKGSIHVEQCDPQAGNPARWQDAPHQAMLHLAAKLVAHLCLSYDIPIRKINSTQLRAGDKGICGHADVTAAWHQTTHTDPGVGYPWAQFIGLVESYAHPKPHPPTPKPSWEDDMQILVRESGIGTPVWVSNYVQRCHVANETELKQIISGWKSSGAPDWVCEVHIVPAGTLGAYGIDVTPAVTA